MDVQELVDSFKGLNGFIKFTNEMLSDSPPENLLSYLESLISTTENFNDQPENHSKTNIYRYTKYSWFNDLPRRILQVPEFQSRQNPSYLSTWSYGYL